MPLPVERVMVVCSHCDRPTRIAHRTLDNGSRVRVCRHCGEPIEVKS
jgi:large subunit ribosomal protein L24